MSTGNSASSYGTYPDTRRNLAASMGSPFTSTSPAATLAGSADPAITDSSVVLPAPLGPTIATSSPGGASHVTPRSSSL